ncbi:hypothetical protein LSG23_20590 (plasmid) [Bacillus velezensis]|uniref:ParM/StbA family protein n=1 Tax=Bacillus velezensis TaxID=492670 RepID=UPI0009880F2E|nr:hypothetical protein [Bacillus velezensis]AQS42484.1 hypothetical protein BVH55_00375 [Bacillus velezensis]WNR83192.1 hypothetical protein RP314_20740 [Bacillus velezensis]
MGKINTFAIDLGNGFVKAKSEKKLIVAPSSIAREKDLGKSSIDVYNNNGSSVKIFDSILKKGVNYVWGEGIKNVVNSSNKLLSSYTFEGRYGSDNYKLLVDFVLGDLASDYKEKHLEVRVITGMPSDELEQEDRQTLEDVFEGSHVVKINGVEKVIDVVEVKVLEQPMGSLFHQLIDNNLEMSVDFTKRIAFYDFGAGTTILDVFENGKRDEDESITELQGMNDVYKTVKRLVQKKYGIKKLTVYEIEEAFKNNFNIEIGSKTFNCEEIAKEVINDFLDTVMSTFQGVLNSRDYIEKIYITGGGLNIVKDEIGRFFKEEESVIYIENSQTAGVEGFYKFGEVMNSWEEE